MKNALLLLITVLGFIQPVLAINLPLIFQSNMVLQRDKEIKIWGFGKPGENIHVSFLNNAYNTITGKDNKWMIKMPAVKAGGPYELTVTGSDTSIVLSNVLMGDLWLCGGQSNMQYSLDQIGYSEKDSIRLQNKQLRLFTASIGMDYVPTDDLTGGSWKIATLETIKNFSAVAYFFARHLQDSMDVPIGLISDNLGATAVETWMSPAALSQFPQFNNFSREYLSPKKSFRQINADFESMKPGWERKYYLTGEGIRQKWWLPETDTTGWKNIEVPFYWEDNGYPDFDGAMWFRKSFDLPVNFKEEKFRLALNQVDDYDMVWVNGIKVGEGYGNINWRNYYVPANILKPKNNTLVVRVFDVGGKGGIYSNAIWGNPVLLGTWKFKPDIKIDAAKFKKPLFVNASPFSTPSVLYNANIAPISRLAIKGVIYYQGESNVNRAEEYLQLFPALIKDWRTTFHDADLPFIFVQLANYMQEVNEPGESNWAELRDAQASALSLPATGMAVAIEVGEANDIHPKNKMDVGKRLALEAMRVAYKKDIISRGPVFESMNVKDSQIIIHYSKESGELVTKNKYGFVPGFAIAGTDNKFYWATAYIKNNTVIISSPHVNQPVNARYAWSDNPGELSLYNKEGLPAVPFKTDKLPYKTAGKVFSDNPWEL